MSHLICMALNDQVYRFIELCLDTRNEFCGGHHVSFPDLLNESLLGINDLGGEAEGTFYDRRRDLGEGHFLHFRAQHCCSDTINYG